MSTDQDLLIAAAVVIILENEEEPTKDKALQHTKLRKRRFWVHPSLRSKSRYRARVLMEDLLFDDVDDLNLEYRGCGIQNLFRMKNDDFVALLRLIGPHIEKKDTTFRRAISAHDRLAVTLRFLTMGESYHSLSHLFKISKQSISQMIPNVCDAICSVLQDYIKIPQNEADWKAIAKEFKDKWHFPNCVGVFDGKHISLQAPINSGSFRIVLFAIIDADYNFIYTNVYSQGRISDSNIFSETHFKKCLQDSTIHLPSSCPLPGRSIAAPFVFVANDAFPLLENIMKPFPGAPEKDSKESIFNYRLGKACRVSENTFGIISSMYRVLGKPLLLEPERATKVIRAILYLHNFLRKSDSKAIYNPPGTFDSDCTTTGEIDPGVWRQSSSNKALLDIPRTSTRSDDDSQEIRNEFAEFFSSSDGVVAFQSEKWQNSDLG